MAIPAWGVSPLGNLSEFPVPQFETGKGLAEILALRQRQQEHAQQALTGAAENIAGMMEQRKRDQMYNSLMDQYLKEYGVANPFSGQGEQGFKAASELIKLRQQAEKQGLAERMVEARISRLGSGGGGGGGRGGGGSGGGGVTGAATPEVVEKDGIKYQKIITSRGVRFERLPLRFQTGTSGQVPEGTANAKDSDYFKLLKRQGQIEAEGTPDEAPSRELQAINMRIAQIQGARQPPPPKEIAEPQWSFKAQTPQVEKGTTMPKTQLAEGYGVTLPAGTKRVIMGVPHVWDGMKWVPE